MLLTACADDAIVGVTGQYDIVFGVRVSGIDRSRGSSPDAVRHFNICDTADTVAVECRQEDMCSLQTSGRGAPTEEITSFRAWAYLHDGGTDKIFFTDEPVIDKGSYWTTQKLYYWPTSKDMLLSFTAVAGMPDTGMVADMSATASDLALRYTVPSDPAAQTDVMLAQSDQVNGSGIADYCVPLNFRHICTAVRFRTGNELQPGRIEKITLSGIRSSGTYSGGRWQDLAGVQSFSIDTPVVISGEDTPGKDLYQTWQTFMLLPQTLGEDARLEVVFRDEISGSVRTLSTSLAGQQWPMGKITTYYIGISPAFNLEFTTVPPVQDAHYVMCNTSISISGIAADAGWTLTAAASDGADVTVQRESEVNEYARQGFWIDKAMSNGVVQQNTSVRGTSVISGTGNVDNLEIRIFIPENVGEDSRDITLRLQADGAPAVTSATQTVTQLCPAWNGSTGWEQIYGDERGIYGFCYDARHVYVYNNSHGSSQANRIVNQVQSLIDQYGASDYAEVKRFDVITWVSYRNYVSIDYRRLNTLEGRSESASDGLRNTRELFTFGGTAISRNYENALIDMARVTDTSVKAYRERSPDDPSSVPEIIRGTEINESQALGAVLKKNRYYLNTVKESEITTTAPMIRADDIVWYLPASGQFGTAPAWEAGNPADYWSSTSAAGSDAYTGGGAVISRTALRSVRVARNRP